MENLNFIIEAVYEILSPKGVNFQIDNSSDSILIEPSTVDALKNLNVNVDGLQITYFFNSKIYEVAEIQAGKNKNELWVYLETPDLQLAIKEILKGNNRKPIKIWK